MMFFKKKNNNKALDFVKEADQKIATAFRSNNVMVAKDVVTMDMFRNLRTEINFCHVQDDEKFAHEKLMERNYTVVSEDENTAVIKRDIVFKKIKMGVTKLSCGLNFSELITVDKTNGFAISAIAAA